MNGGIFCYLAFLALDNFGLGFLDVRILFHQNEGCGENLILQIIGEVGICIEEFLHFLLGLVALVMTEHSLYPLLGEEDVAGLLEIFQ